MAIYLSLFGMPVSASSRGAAAGSKLRRPGALAIQPTRPKKRQPGFNVQGYLADLLLAADSETLIPPHVRAARLERARRSTLRGRSERCSAFNQRNKEAELESLFGVPQTRAPKLHLFLLGTPLTDQSGTGPTSG